MCWLLMKNQTNWFLSRMLAAWLGLALSACDKKRNVFTMQKSCSCFNVGQHCGGGGGGGSVRCSIDIK